MVFSLSYYWNSNSFNVFNHAELGFVRVVMKDGEPWFVGKDVAEVLGYGNPSKAINVHVREKNRFSEMLPNSQNGRTVGKYLLINEAGLYSLILRSKLPQAEQFEDWVTSEVLPSIRKHGGYLTREKVEEALTDRNWTPLHGTVHLVSIPYFYPCLL